MTNAPEQTGEGPAARDLTSRSAGAAACLGLVALALAVGATPLSNNDIWLHLTTGRLILERGAVPRVDEYSFTMAGAPYVAHEWLAQVLLVLVHRAGGVAALILLQPLALLGAASAVTLASRRLGATQAASFGAGAIAILAMTTHLSTRPHLFTFVLLAAANLLVLAWRRGDRGALGPLLAAQALWANLHGGFVLGIALACAMGAWIPAAAMSAVSLLNPRGAGLFRFLLVFTDPVFRRRIREWGSPFDAPFAGSILFFAYLALLGMAALAVLHLLRTRRFGPALTVLLFAGLSASSKRSISLLGIVAAPWIALAWSERVRRPSAAGARDVTATAAAMIGLAVTAAIAGVPHESGQPRRPGLGIGPNIPVAAMDYVVLNGMKGNALASFGFASYVTYRAFPASKVFIDSRLDVYGGAFIERYERAMADPERMRDVLKAFPVDYAVLSYRLDEVEGAVTALQADPEWALVYFDDIAMIYLKRTPESAALAARDEYRLVNPWIFLAGRFDPSRAPDTALAETARAISVAPRSSMARLMRATSLQAAGRHRDAAVTLEEAASMLAPDDPGEPLRLGLLGTSYLALGDTKRAEAAFRRLQALQPSSAYARKMLSEIQARGGR